MEFPDTLAALNSVNVTIPESSSEPSVILEGPGQLEEEVPLYGDNGPPTQPLMALTLTQS